MIDISPPYIDEITYRDLCQCCDALLHSEPRIERVAIPWLHVIREHPVFLTQYRHLYDGRDAKWRRLAVATRYRLQQRWRVAKALRHGHELSWCISAALPRHIDVLFVSHLLNASHVAAPADFYFGGLPQALAEEGLAVAIALINHTAAPAEVAEGWAQNSVPRIVLRSLLDVRQERTIQARLNVESALLRPRAGDPAVQRRIRAWASAEAVAGSAAMSLRISWQVGELVTRLRPKVVITTHEGHATERLMFAAARRVDARVRCMAYQHAALFRLQHAIRRPLAPIYNPDVIFTAGHVSWRQLEAVPALRSTPKHVLGSPRAIGPAAIDAQRRRAGGEACCLVIPEGYESECVILFRFALEAAALAPDITFIFRTHPILPLHTLRSKMPNLSTLPPNVHLSTKSFEEDLARSRWALYRGTTAAVQAVVAGVRPVYLERAHELTIDPLYELSAWRAIVRAPGDLAELMHRGGEELAQRKARDQARAYCGEFFVKLDHTVMLDAIRSLPGHHA